MGGKVEKLVGKRRYVRVATRRAGGSAADTRHVSISESVWNLLVLQFRIQMTHPSILQTKNWQIITNLPQYQETR